MLGAVLEVALVERPFASVGFSEEAAFAVFHSLLTLAKVDFILSIDICNFVI